MGTRRFPGFPVVRLRLNDRAGDIRDAVERVPTTLNGYSQDGRRQSLANILGCTGRLLEGILSIAIHRLML